MDKNHNMKSRKTVIDISRRWWTPITNPKARKQFLNEFYNKQVVHGTQYFAKDELHWTEKLFWLIIICLSFYLCIYMGLQAWDQYLHKSVVVSIKRDHYGWNTTMPALTICPGDRISKELFKKSFKYLKLKKEELNELYEFLNSLANATYINLKYIKSTSNTDDILNRTRIKPNEYMRLLYKLTEDMSQSDVYENKIKNFNEKEFIAVYQILTEFGICYITNNFIGANLSTSYLLNGKYPDMSEYHYDVSEIKLVKQGNIFDGDLTYTFSGFRGAITTFIHSPYEIMNIAKNLGIRLETIEFITQAEEMLASPELALNTWVIQRSCRFFNESNLVHYPIYTRQLCIAECRLNLVYEKCGCIPHFYPNKIKHPKPVCDYKQLKTCVAHHAKLFLELNERLSNGSYKFIKCDCLANCESSNVIIEHVSRISGADQMIGSLGGLVTVKKHPQIRYERQVLYSFFDFLNAIGGAASLFIGFSVKGFLLTIYYFTVKVAIYKYQ